jgi:SAM-dependent methyltransferase
MARFPTRPDGRPLLRIPRFVRAIKERNDPPRDRNKWERYALPEDMTGKSFMDVGCWEGVNCAEATRRNAEHVVGLDLCTSDELRKNVDKFGFEFVQMDIFSEKWLELDSYDVVVCSGVLYHVENVVSLLLRLRKVTRGLLVLETATRDVGIEEPLLMLKTGDQDDANLSNWWVPNRSAVFELLRLCGFESVTPVWERERPSGSRLCVHAEATGKISYERILPRKPEAMSLLGGARTFD